MIMESLKQVPDHWLIDTGVTTYWPSREGVWVNDDTKPILRLACVYNELLDISEARTQIESCNRKFLDQYASVLLSYFQPVMQKVRTGEKGIAKSVSQPLTSDADAEKASAIYKEWVDIWALGSTKMLELVIGFNVTSIILDMLGLNRQELRQLKGRLSDLSSSYSPPWVWEMLLSGEYRRIDQTKRELARCEVQNKGFYRVRERQLLTHARYWIIIRVLRVSPRNLLDELAKRSSKHDFRLTENDLTDKILKPFDDTLEYERKPGRPQVKNRVNVKLR